ncbi:MAG: glutamate synthase [Desulfuromonas sp.]|nr:MAG: glutamate synthase [Desulfuromonas sp.]
MFRLLLSTGLLFLLPLTVLAESADVKLLRQARSQIEIIAGELRQRVSRDVREKGAADALGACRLQVEGITDRLMSSSGWEIRRTSFKARNPGNSPDTWERDVLELFAMRQAAGDDLSSFEFAKLINVEGRRVFRYMKPIIVQKPCLTCHGSNLSAEVASQIAARYPDDKATGYRTGELRGAFSLLKVLPGAPPAALPGE